MRYRGSVNLIVLLCFFFSGLAGLIYEIHWMRSIVSIIGAAPFAVSIVLTIFMGGLGLGSYLASRYIDRLPDPSRTLRAYALLELAIGAYALLIPVLLIVVRPLWAVVYNSLYDHSALYHLLTFLLAALLFGLPVIAMGATLPVLSRFSVTNLARLGTNLGRLYGLNTLGAAAGSFLCGFLMIQYLGMPGTLAAAVAVNLAIGLLCLALARHLAGTASPAPETAPLRPQPSVTLSPGVALASLAVFAASGFCSMASEVTWSRMLGLLVGPTTYSFTIVLVTFIVGLALGSILFGRLADRTGRPVELLLITQIAAALLILLVSHLLGNSQLFFAKLLERYKDNFHLLTAAKAGVIFLFMLPPTLCLGATFPLVTKICTRAPAQVGSSVGRAYAVNTLGCVLGSFLAGFAFIPLLGAEGAVRLFVAVQILAVLALALVVLSADRPRRSFAGVAAVLALVVAAAATVLPSFNRLLFANGKYMRFEQLDLDLPEIGWLQALTDGPELLAAHERSQVLYYADGLGGTVAVLKDQDVFGNDVLFLTCSGKPDASSRVDMATQTLSAHIPLMFHPDPSSVMVLGLASGVTAGEALLYPIDSLDIVEISPEVVRASHFFDRWNGRVLDDPRTRLILQDGRAHLTLTDRSYDVIISEPSNPWMAGLAALFSREFFAAAHDRLRDRGIFVQFLHAYSMDWATFALIGRTFTEVFPQSMLVSTSPGGIENDFLLVGFKDSLSLDPHVAARNLPHIRKSANIQLTSIEPLYPLIVTENPAAAFGAGPVHHDARPRLEFAAPRLVFLSDERILSMLASHRTASETTRRLANQTRRDPAAILSYARFALSVYQPFAGITDPGPADTALTGTLDSLLCAYCRSVGVNMSVLGDSRALAPCRDCQIERLLTAVDSVEHKDIAYGYLVRLLLQSYRVPDALSAAADWTAAAPASVEAHINHGLILAISRNFAAASRAFEIALSLDPNSAIAHHNLGRTRLDLGDPHAALLSFREALRLEPDFAEAHCYLGLAYLAANQRDSAVTALSTALRLKPDLAAAREGLARASALRSPR